jgi:hypothetical protein
MPPPVTAAATGSWIREGSARVGRKSLLDGRVRALVQRSRLQTAGKRSSAPAPSRLGGAAPAPPHSSEGLSAVLSTFSTAEARRSTLASTCPQSPRGYWSNAKQAPSLVKLSSRVTRPGAAGAVTWVREGAVEGLEDWELVAWAHYHVYIYIYTHTHTPQRGM